MEMLYCEIEEHEEGWRRRSYCTAELWSERYNSLTLICGAKSVGHPSSMFNFNLAPDQTLQVWWVVPIMPDVASAAAIGAYISAPWPICNLLAVVPNISGSKHTQRGFRGYDKLPMSAYVCEAWPICHLVPNLRYKHI